MKIHSHRLQWHTDWSKVVAVVVLIQYTYIILQQNNKSKYTHSFEALIEDQRIYIISGIILQSLKNDKLTSFRMFGSIESLYSS